MIMLTSLANQSWCFISNPWNFPNTFISFYISVLYFCTWQAMACKCYGSVHCSFCLLPAVVWLQCTSLIYLSQCREPLLHHKIVCRHPSWILTLLFCTGHCVTCSTYIMFWLMSAYIVVHILLQWMVRNCSGSSLCWGINAVFLPWVVAFLSVHVACRGLNLHHAWK